MAFEDEELDFALPEERSFFSATWHPSHGPPHLRIGKRRARPEAKRPRIDVSGDVVTPPRQEDTDPKRPVQKWTQKEKDMFLRSIKDHGKNWGIISSLIPSKNEAQIKNYYQNYKNRLGLQEMLPRKEGGIDETEREASSESSTKSPSLSLELGSSKKVATKLSKKDRVLQRLAAAQSSLFQSNNSAASVTLTAEIASLTAELGRLEEKKVEAGPDPRSTQSIKVSAPIPAAAMTRPSDASPQPMGHFDSSNIPNLMGGMALPYIHEWPIPGDGLGTLQHSLPLSLLPPYMYSPDMQSFQQRTEATERSRSPLLRVPPQSIFFQVQCRS